MQTLWSRVAQAQSSCRCRVCLHSANTIVRRSTTAASRRKVSGADIFTACYTSILGTAAVLDAKRKDARRKELDEKLENARASLSTLAVQEAPAIAEERQVIASDSSGRHSHNRAARVGKSGGTHALSDELNHFEAFINSKRRRTSRSYTPVDWAPIEAAIEAEERDPEIVLRHPNDEVQMQKTIGTVEALVEDLLQRIGSPPISDDVVIGNVSAAYNNPHADIESATEGRQLLSTSFREIFAVSQTAEEVVARICRNLLASSAAPNIHNYNTLIAGFHRIRRPDLADSVVDSYLYRSRWPATQQTMVCLLNHARSMNDLRRFREVVARMRGTVEDGLHFRLIGKDNVYNDVGLAWAADYAVERKSTFVERAPRGDEIFDNLIRGWLHFGHVQAASMSLVACVRNGRDISSETLHQLLKECIETFDQSGAYALLRGFIKNFSKFELFAERVLLQVSTQLADKIAAMLFSLFDLCALSHRSATGSHNHDLGGFLKVIRNLQDELLAKISARDHRASWDHEEDHDEKPKWLERPTSYKLNAALGQIMANLHVQHTSPTAIRARPNPPSLDELVESYKYLRLRMERLEAHAKIVIIKHKTGLDLGTWCQLPPIDQVNSRWHGKCRTFTHALEGMRIGPGPLRPTDVKAHLLQHLPDQHLARNILSFVDWKDLDIAVVMSLFHWPEKRYPRGLMDPMGSRLLTVRRIEKAVLEAEERIRTVLFCSLSVKRQKKLRFLYDANWNKVPLALLFKMAKEGTVLRAGGPPQRSAIPDSVAGVTWHEREPPAETMLLPGEASYYPDMPSRGHASNFLEAPGSMALMRAASDSQRWLSLGDAPLHQSQYQGSLQLFYG